jgi:predicted homoserine dehydrogenase-like protein
MRTEVIAWAKKDLEPGEVLDGPGGFASYGLIENRDGNLDQGLPILLSKGVRMVRSVPKGQRINWEDVDTTSVPADVIEAWKAAVRTLP